MTVSGGKAVHDTPQHDVAVVLGDDDRYETEPEDLGDPMRDRFQGKVQIGGSEDVPRDLEDALLGAAPRRDECAKPFGRHPLWGSARADLARCRLLPRINRAPNAASRTIAARAQAEGERGEDRRARDDADQTDRPDR